MPNWILCRKKAERNTEAEAEERWNLFSRSSVDYLFYDTPESLTRIENSKFVPCCNITYFVWFSRCIHTTHNNFFCMWKRKNEKKKKKIGTWYLHWGHYYYYFFCCLNIRQGYVQKCGMLYVPCRRLCLVVYTSIFSPINGYPINNQILE